MSTNNLDDLVDQKELSAFHDEVYELARRRFGTDEEGRSGKVQVILVDRSRCHRLQYQPVPYDHRKNVDWDAVELALFLNLHLATDAVDLWWKLRQDREEMMTTDKQASIVNAAIRLRKLVAPVPLTRHLEAGTYEAFEQEDAQVALRELLELVDSEDKPESVVSINRLRAPDVIEAAAKGIGNHHPVQALQEARAAIEAAILKASEQ